MSTYKSLTQTAAQLGRDAGESVEELGRSASWTLGEARCETADALHAAANSVRATGHEGSKAIENLAAGTADRLDATASYVEHHGLRSALAGLRKLGSRHPTCSVVTGAAIGFLAVAALCLAVHSRAKRA